MSNSLPATGVGSFTGNAFGSVLSNGARYLAAGQFNNTYDFGTRTGTLAISNFDGRSFSGTVTAGVGATYGGALSGPGLTGRATGAFFGPLAPETAGNFAVQSNSGPAYLASGIFAGKR
jgi:hypothetical protein